MKARLLNFNDIKQNSIYRLQSNLDNLHEINNVLPNGDALLYLEPYDNSIGFDLPLIIKKGNYEFVDEKAIAPKYKVGDVAYLKTTRHVMFTRNDYEPYYMPAKIKKVYFRYEVETEKGIRGGTYGVGEEVLLDKIPNEKTLTISEIERRLGMKQGTLKIKGEE